MTGAKIWMAPGDCLSIPREPRVEKLAMLAPPVECFAAPGALDEVTLPLFLRSGGRDKITPPGSHREFLRALPECVEVDYQVVAEAGHFSFMDKFPPGETETLPDGPGYRAQLVAEILDFAHL
ncbi:hypothetical protein [Croceibacterium aestuarii]|uniref:hypothetical protein n=1 Tax=Croceibacterium aestuarii TaxID=3064139 RepID=UPI00272EBE32|nr:hypothetical protein [Croceibacterium sp. D39]